jgi:hypothetical protein
MGVVAPGFSWSHFTTNGWAGAESFSGLALPGMFAARGMVRCGSLASSAAMEAPSMARKNQIANGMAAGHLRAAGVYGRSRPRLLLEPFHH